MHTFFVMCGNYPVDYNYDDKFGVKVLYDDGGTRKAITLTSDEMTAPEADVSAALFGHFDTLLRTKIHQALPDCR